MIIVHEVQLMGFALIFKNCCGSGRCLKSFTELFKANTFFSMYGLENFVVIVSAVIVIDWL